MRYHKVLHIVELWFAFQVVVAGGLLDDVFNVIQSPHHDSTTDVATSPPSPPLQTAPSSPQTPVPASVSPVPKNPSNRPPAQNNAGAGTREPHPSLPDASARGTTTAPSLSSQAPTQNANTNPNANANANANTNTNTNTAANRFHPHSNTSPTPVDTTQPTRSGPNFHNISSASNRSTANSTSTLPSEEDTQRNGRQAAPKMPIIVGVLCALVTTMCSGILFFVCKKRRRAWRAKQKSRGSMASYHSQQSPRVPPMTAAAAADDIFMAQRTMDDYHLPKQPSIPNLQSNAMYPPPCSAATVLQGDRDSRILSTIPTYAHHTPFYAPQDGMQYVGPYHPTQPGIDAHEREGQEYYHADNSLSQGSTLRSSMSPALTGATVGFTGPIPSPEQYQQQHTVFSPPHTYDS